MEHDPGAPNPYGNGNPVEPAEGVLLDGGYGWLELVCRVVQAASLATIAITLIARL